MQSGRARDSWPLFFPLSLWSFLIFGFLALLIHRYVYTWCVYVGVPVWKSEGNFMSQLSPPASMWVPGIELMSLGFCGKCMPAHSIILLALALESSYVKGG